MGILQARILGCHAYLQGIFPTQESNPGLLHYRRILYLLSHQGWRRLFYNSINCKDMMIMQIIFTHRNANELLLAEVQLTDFCPIENYSLLPCCCSLLSHVWLFFDPMDCRPPGSSVPGISQALEPVAIFFYRRSSQPRDWTWVSYVRRQILYRWATSETL